MNRHVGYGHRAHKSSMPANSNSNEDEPDRTGQFEWWARCAIHDLLTIKELDEGRELIAMYITDWIEGRRHHHG